MRYVIQVDDCLSVLDRESLTIPHVAVFVQKWIPGVSQVGYESTVEGYAGGAGEGLAVFADDDGDGACEEWDSGPSCDLS